ncbi:MAG: hypothetical protein KU37_00085 [Sulfuricurvum sp. PC08-66]|nr:MAG: hypothetical protein KU37_00085 [Sulfuricurvum sp. PC08-66]
MQTFTLEVQDSFVPNFLDYLKQFKNEVTVHKDKNIESDPNFYERQKELQQIRDDIKSGKIDMVPHEDIWGNIKKHLNTFENN